MLTNLPTPSQHTTTVYTYDSGADIYGKYKINIIFLDSKCSQMGG